MMLRLLLVILSILFQFKLVTCDIYTYWIDSSCNGRVTGVVIDAVLMAAGASFRLSNPADQNQQEIFSLLFKIQASDPAANAEVQRIMGGVGSFRPGPDRPSSDVRIYCDGDALAPQGRWSLVPDIDHDPFPNSRREFGKTQEWEDKLNALGRATNTQGCRDGSTLAETYHILRTPQGSVVNQNPLRSSITLCNKILEDQAGIAIFPKSFFDFNPTTDFAEPSVDNFETLLSVVMLHEFTHTRRFGTIDVPLPRLTPDSDGEYLRAETYELAVNSIESSADALRNADTYAFFGLFARLADFHHSLARENEARRDGQLHYFTQLLPPDPRLNTLPLSQTLRKRTQLNFDDWIPSNMTAGEE